MTSDYKVVTIHNFTYTTNLQMSWFGVHRSKAQEWIFSQSRSLFTETWQKRRSSFCFELLEGAFENLISNRIHFSKPSFCELELKYLENILEIFMNSFQREKPMETHVARCSFNFIHVRCNEIAQIKMCILLHKIQTLSFMCQVLAVHTWLSWQNGGPLEVV